MLKRGAVGAPRQLRFLDNRGDKDIEVGARNSGLEATRDRGVLMGSIKESTDGDRFIIITEQASSLLGFKDEEILGASLSWMQLECLTLKGRIAEESSP